MTEIPQIPDIRMIDVGAKGLTRREALVRARVVMRPETLEAILSGALPKGDVLSAARLAGIMAAKRTPTLIPLCHPVRVDQVEIFFTTRRDDSSILVETHVKGIDRTGMEMEAMMAASVAALTIYDMGKSIDPTMVISDLRLVRKTGGKSGTYQREGEEDGP